MSMKRTVASVLFCVAASGTARAQSTVWINEVRETALVRAPVSDPAPAGPMAAGKLLERELVHERGGRDRVRPLTGGSGRTGLSAWINANRTGSISRCTEVTCTQDSPGGTMQEAEPTADRKGFIIGGGAGIGLHSTPSIGLGSAAGSTNNFAIVTNFMVGYAPTEQLLLFYSNKATFTTDERFDALGVTGFGATYIFRPTSPTWHVSGSVGGGFGATLDGRGTSDAGLGWSAGAGWEFSRHLSVEGDVLFVRIGSGRTHTVYRGLFHYTFY